jgi:hypothetical protein
MIHLSHQIDLPHIECPVHGVAHTYTLDIAAEKGSKELKYRLYGTFYSYPEPTEVTVVGIYVSTENPHKITFGYVDPNDNQLHVSLANGIKEIKNDDATVAESEKEDYLIGLHHGSSLFIRYRNKKTFLIKASPLNRTIRGNADYRIFDVKNNADGKLEFIVSYEHKPTEKFTVVADGIQHGTWHKIPGSLCPVPGVDPDERNA